MYTDIKNNLDNSLSIVFRDTKEIGFWDPQNKFISEKLVNDKHWNWRSLKSHSHRYGVFTLSMILLSKDLYNLDTEKYDDKIIDFIHWIYNHLEKLETTELTYGALTSVILGRKLYELYDLDLTKIEHALTNAYNNIYPFFDNQNSLILIASKYFLDQRRNLLQFENMNELTSLILSSRNKSAYFETGDIRAIYHQRIMYTLWALSFVSTYYAHEDIKLTIEDTINYVWKKRRDKKDNAFLWHPSLYFIKYRNGFKIPVYNPKSAKYLFECHQTFFANAINFYQEFFNPRTFQTEKERAMEWITGENRISKDLNKVTGIGIPVRIMDLMGNLFIDGQQFKGSYEIGSLILALSAQNFQK